VYPAGLDSELLVPNYPRVEHLTVWELLGPTHWIQTFVNGSEYLSLTLGQVGLNSCDYVQFPGTKRFRSDQIRSD